MQVKVIELDDTLIDKLFQKIKILVPKMLVGLIFILEYQYQILFFKLKIINISY
jgi:hypothetical protein